MQIKTPAKINPVLHILGKRDDGFHDLYMHMAPVSIFDCLSFIPNQGRGLNFKMQGACFDEPEEQNIVVRAVRLFEKKFDLRIDLDVLLEKKIPAGAGLGGGSGNAAGTLLALKKIYQENKNIAEQFSSECMHEMAATLGSDVPFFLSPAPCELRGRGEKIKSLKKYPEFPIIIIKPSFSISTADAYKNCQPEPLNKFPKVQNKAEFEQHLYNQFENSLISMYPILAEMKENLIKNGAFGALVSGSGSAVFGVFENILQQKQAFNGLQSQQFGELFACQTMRSHTYF